ncbi:hypothetical protein QBC37DRAFT_371563 [Rhypophila decipiens]|uniref:Uncharacterized protein n=1 Tax=Rhypophila decipiens TaxID=261697 RepID=A0AAN6YC53_9PEZI|nr:hypothetical protein QBC37DRAFT_371563 [Rhypophila decipiens]
MEDLCDSRQTSLTYKYVHFGEFTKGAAASRPPPGTANGVYSVHLDANGTAIHTLLAPALSGEELAQLSSREPARLSSALSRITARQVSAGGCHTYELDHGSTDIAVESLKNQCTPVGAVNGNRNFYSIYGTTVAYICNMNKDAWTCQRHEVEAAYAAITSFCGWYKAGWRNEERPGKGWASTGYELTGSNFCGRGV